MSIAYIVTLIVVALILVFLYAKYWKHNIYGGKFQEHFKDADENTITKNSEG